MLSRLALISGFKMIEMRVIEAVERSLHQQPDTGPDSRFRGPKKGGYIAYLCLQQVRKPENQGFQTVLPVNAHLWTGRGLQVKLSRQWFLQKEGRCDNLGCAANKNHYFLNLEN